MKKIFNYILNLVLFGHTFLGNNNFKSINKSSEYQLYKVKSELEKNLSEKIENFKNKKNANIEVFSIQYLFNHLINNKYFNQKILQCIDTRESFFFPLPSDCLNIINKNGINVNFTKSNFLWKLYLILNFTYQNIKFIYNFKFYFSQKEPNLKNKTLIYLDSIPKIDHGTEHDTRLNNFYHWCILFLNNNEKRITNNIVFFHNNKQISYQKIIIDKFQCEIIYKEKYFFDDLKVYKYLASYFRSLVILSKLGIEFLTALNSLHELEYIKKTNTKIAEHSFFNNSKMVIKPIYLNYEIDIDKKKSDYLYFFSTNIIPLCEKPQEVPNLFGYRIQNWSSYIIWNSFQKKWLEHCIDKDFTSYNIESIIPFEGKNIYIKKNHKRVVIFDVPPKKEEYFNNYMHVENLYTVDYCKKYLTDTVTASISECNLEVFYKIKRNLKSTDKQYKKLINKFVLKEKKFNIFYDDISAQSLIQSSDAAISIPFTSSALVADVYKIPSIYYSPKDLKFDENFFPTDGKYISNLTELKKWLKKI